jgi:hypothetical protein
LTAVDDHGTRARKIDAFLTEHARQLCPRTIDYLATRLLDVLDPTRTDRYDPDAYTRRRLSSATDTTGMLVGRFQLDPAGGAALKAAPDLHAARKALQDTNPHDTTGRTLTHITVITTPDHCHHPHRHRHRHRRRRRRRRRRR